MVHLDAGFIWDYIKHSIHKFCWLNSLQHRVYLEAMNSAMHRLVLFLLKHSLASNAIAWHAVVEEKESGASLFTDAGAIRILQDDPSCKLNDAVPGTLPT